MCVDFESIKKSEHEVKKNTTVEVPETKLKKEGESIAVLRYSLFRKRVPGECAGLARASSSLE
jgi:hypothetical protein